MRFLKVYLVSLVFFVSACSHFKKKDEFNLRKTERVQIGNGLEVMYVHDPALPRIHLELVLKSGSVSDPRGQEGVSQLMAALLESGTSHRSTNQIAEDLGMIGASFESSVSLDFARFSTSSLSMNRDRLLEIFVDLLLNPQFKNEEVQRVKSEQILAIKRTQDQPSSWAKVLTDKEFYQGHVYARPVRGEELSVSRLGRTEIQAHYNRMMRPKNAILVVSGQISESFKSQVEIAFAGWSDSQQDAPEVLVDTGTIPTRTNKQIVYFDRPEAQQVDIRVIQLGVTRNDKRFLALRLANMVLGGSFASRLNQRVRDDLGLTYGIYSNLDARKLPGIFDVSAATRPDKAAELIDETLKLIKDFADKGITESELAAAKSVLIGQFPLSIEVVENHGFNMALLDVYGVPQTYLTKFVNNVNAITLTQVNQAIKELVKPETVLITVQGNKKFLEPSIQQRLK